MNWKVDLAKKAKRQLGEVRGPDLYRLGSALTALEIEPRPHGAIKVQGTSFHRLRVGNWRVIYEIFDEAKLVVIVLVLRRNERTYGYLP